MRGWRVSIVVVLLLGAGVSACASRTTPPLAGASPQAQAGATKNLAAVPRSMEPGSGAGGARAVGASEGQAPRQGLYRLQLGDEMDVAFYRTPELNTHTKIRPDGNITLPFVGDVHAAEMEPAELADALEQRYTGELRAPHITVNVTNFGGQRVYVGGEVATPGVLQLIGPVTALQAIQQAGGFRETASLRGVVLIRRSGGKVRGTEVDLSDVVSGDEPEADPLLQPFDIVFVPRTYIADIDLFVDQYIRKILPMNPSFGIGLGTF